MMDAKAKRTRGGKRAGAGRKKSPFRRHDPPHRRRPELSARHPVHIVLRTVAEMTRLRRRPVYRALRGVLARYLGQDDFRIVHLSIQHNHLHLIVEAADRGTLTRRMRSFAINAARAINFATDRRCGKVFAHRYHATQIKTPWQTRNALSYVLNNWRRHREDLQTEQTRAAALDPYASGILFDGWTRRRLVVPETYVPLPVSPARTALLCGQWAWYGRIDPFECPGPIWQ